MARTDIKNAQQGGRHQPFTVTAYLRQLTGPAGLRLDDLLDWPPDMFGATAAVLKRTGAYRHAVCPPRTVLPSASDNQSWPPSAWNRIVQENADVWLQAINSPKPFRVPSRTASELLGSWRTVRDLGAKVPLANLAMIDDLNEDTAATAWRLCKALLAIHAIADRACRGFGTPVSPDRQQLTQFIADHYLSISGSLSRLPRQLGVVLPKMRTPQRGLTIRTLSLYATWHETEVEVLWRSMPWVNADENVINALLIPWPLDVSSDSFQPALDLGGRRVLGDHRYFTFDARKHITGDLVVGAIRAAKPCAARVHLLVFPELALADEELNIVKASLIEAAKSEEGLPGATVPMILTGVRSKRGSKDKIERCNSAKLSVFFADKWYDLWQDKHHRWKMDGAQLRQYNLGGALSTERHWWENIYIPRRRLCFLSPNGWLTLCPLICEDLAQLEPLAEVIRGVGPTFVVALLLDGPQLKDRWSARYATVLADDPGTSVLTLSARGMVQRSRPSAALYDDEPADPARKSIVALWRDPRTGSREISMGRSDAAVLLTLTASWREEFTSDGRGDGGSAAMFVLSGVHTIGQERIEWRTPPEAGTGQTGESAHVVTGRPTDLTELSTVTELVDALLDADHDTRTALLAIAAGHHLRGARSKAHRELAHRIRSETRRYPRANRDYVLGLALIRDLMNSGSWPSPTPLGSPRPSLRTAAGPDQEQAATANFDRWRRMVEVVKNAKHDPERLLASGKPGRGSSVLEPRVLARTTLAVHLAVLWAIHNRLEHARRSGAISQGALDLTDHIERLIARSLCPPIAPT